MAKRPRFKGYFFTFEGGEGSGKSTQARLLAAWLESQGILTLMTREPGGTETGRLIRQLLLDTTSERLAERAELLLYEADRAHHVATKILPALMEGKVVICDRFSDSSTVYQGICRGLGEKQTDALNRFATGDLVPDTVVVLDVPAETGMGRVSQRAARGGALDRMESEELTFHKKVRSGFLKLARKQPSRYVVLDGRKDQASLETAIRKVAEQKLKRRGLWKV